METVGRPRPVTPFTSPATMKVPVMSRIKGRRSVMDAIWSRTPSLTMRELFSLPQLETKAIRPEGRHAL